MRVCKILICLMLVAAAASTHKGCFKNCIEVNMDNGIKNQMVLNALCKFKCGLEQTTDQIYKVANYVKSVVKENMASTNQPEENTSIEKEAVKVEIEQPEEEPIPSIPKPPQFNAKKIEEIPEENQQNNKDEKNKEESMEKIPDHPICRLGPSEFKIKKEHQIRKVKKPSEKAEKSFAKKPELSKNPVSITPEKEVVESAPKTSEPSEETMNLLRKALNDPSFGITHPRKHFKHLSEADSPSFEDRINRHRQFMGKLLKKMGKIQKNMLGRHMHIVRFMPGINRHHRKHHGRHHGQKGLGHHHGSPGFGHNRHNFIKYFFRNRGRGHF